MAANPLPEAPMSEQFDVVVVGGGNAGHSAALAAAERGRRVVLLEKGRRGEHGGNSFYTAGAMRVAHHGLDDLRDLLDDDERLASTVLPPYPAETYVHDMERVTGGRNDDALTETLVRESMPTLRWLHGQGLRFRLMFERQAYRSDAGEQVFWGGLAVGSTGGGKGLIEQHEQAARDAGVQVRYGCAATDLLTEDGAVVGVRVSSDTPSDDGSDGATTELRAESVILAAGGFEANAAMREQHLGEGWQRAKVRGTPLNTGEMLRAAIDIGAQPFGDWSTCHSVAWDVAAQDEGDRELTNQYTRGGYPLGIMVNSDGQRFVDEGADYRNYTYAKYGAAILRQPGGVAYQLFDATTRRMLRAEDYDHPAVSVVSAPSMEKLAADLGIDAAALIETVAAFNASIDPSVPFDAAVKDGRSADVEPPRSNWALPLETPPFFAFPVTCGITFTFGGLRADPEGRVLTESGAALPGLFVCGEMLGGLFSGNYPGGTGLVSGAVFGRRAGGLA